MVAIVIQWDANKWPGILELARREFIAKIFVYKHCFCYLNVQNVKQKDPLFRRRIALWLAY